MSDWTPRGWTWQRTALLHNSRSYPNPMQNESATTITASFAVDDPSIPPLNPYPDAPLPFIVDQIDAKWVDNDGEQTLIDVTLSGPVKTDRVSTSRITRRGAYTAFRNEIALARADAPAGRSASIPANVVKLLDAWAAIPGNLPVAVTQ